MCFICVFSQKRLVCVCACFIRAPEVCVCRRFCNSGVKAACKANLAWASDTLQLGACIGATDAFQSN